MNRPLRRGTTALTSLLVTAAGLVVLGTTTAPAAQADQVARAAEVSVTDATFTWEVNKESTSGAFAPGTWNLMSAGRIGNPGAGGNTLTTLSSGALWSNLQPAGWSSSVGDVTVEDLAADGSHAPATFAGTRTNTAGANANTSGVSGETRLVFGAGTGTVDPAAGTATIAWDGDATLLYYSGMTFFYLSDPELAVTADGEGTVTATVGGYATSMADPTVWTALPDEEVVIATLSGVDVTADGISTTPEYREVVYEAPESAVAQNRTAATWGAFPQDFVDFQQLVGQGSYWYSSGGSADPRKVASPLSVAYDTTVEPEPATPAVTVSQTDFLPSGAHTVTVQGTGFDPDAVTGTRPPLLGKSGGVYVVFGKFAETWRPSQGALGATRKNTSQQWAVKAEDMATVGGPPAAIELTPEGTFSATLTVDKAAIDAAATDPSLVNYGIYTYPGSGAVNAGFETATPVTFTRGASSLSISAPSRRFGAAAAAAVSITAPDTAGTITLRSGDVVVGTADLTAEDAGTTFPLSGLRAGSYPLTAEFDGNTTSAPSTTTGTLVIKRAVATTRAAVTTAPTTRKAGRLTVRVTSPTTVPNGPVRVTVRDAKGKLVKRATPKLVDGVATTGLPKRAAGRYQVSVSYAGTPNVTADTGAAGYRIR